MCTGTLRANSEGTSGQAREEDSASVHGYTSTLRANKQGKSGEAREEEATSVYRYECARVHRHTMS